MYCLSILLTGSYGRSWEDPEEGEFRDGDDESPSGTSLWVDGVEDGSAFPKGMLVNDTQCGYSRFLVEEESLFTPPPSPVMKISATLPLDNPSSTESIGILIICPALLPLISGSNKQLVGSGHMSFLFTSISSGL